MEIKVYVKRRRGNIDGKMEKERVRKMNKRKREKEDKYGVESGRNGRRKEDKKKRDRRREENGEGRDRKKEEIEKKGEERVEKG